MPETPKENPAFTKYINKIKAESVKLTEQLNNYKPKAGEEDNAYYLQTIKDWINALKLDLELLQLTNVYPNDLRGDYIKQILVRILWSLKQSVKYMATGVLAPLGVVYLFLLFPLYTLSGFVLLFAKSKIGDITPRLIKYFNERDKPINTVINGKLRVFYDDKPNSKGYTINGFDFGVSNKSNPFTSKDEVDAFLKRLTEEFKGDTDTKAKRKNLTKIEEINIQPVPDINYISDKHKTSDTYAQDKQLNTIPQSGGKKYKRKKTNSRKKRKTRRTTKNGRKTYKK